MAGDAPHVYDPAARSRRLTRLMNDAGVSLALLLVIAAAPAPSHAQEPPLDIEAGQPGEPPPGWISPTAGYKAELAETDAAAGKRCARLRSSGDGPAAPFGNLMRQLDATPYRGKVVRFRAAVKVGGTAGGQGQLWLRIDRPNDRTGFFDNMGDRPIRTTTWTHYEIVGDVAADAVRLNLGLLLMQQGEAWLDDVSLEVVGEVEAPRPLKPRALENLVAFTRLLGYVRYFHPSDQARDADWEALALDGLRRVEAAGSAGELAKALNDTFAPVAPTVQVYVTGQKRPALAADLSPRASEEKPKVAYWEHNGVGLSAQTRAIYQSTRHERELVQARISSDVPPPDQPFEAELAGGVTCVVPLTLYTDADGTLPHSPAPPKSPHFYSGNDRATRLAAVALAWNIFQHFYPYFDVVGADWPAELPKALARAAEDKDEREFLDTLRLLVAALRDGHGSVNHRSDDGYAQLPVAWDWIEDKLVITAVEPAGPDEPLPDLKPGDVVTAIDGKPAPDALASAERLFAGATPQFGRWRSLTELRRGPEGEVRLAIARGDGPPREVPVRRTPRQAPVPEQRPEKIAEVKPGVWYVDVARVSDADFRAALPKLEAATGIVFDFRGYPGDFSAQLLFGHISEQSLTSARWTIPVVTRPDTREHQFRALPGWRLSPKQPYVKARKAFITDGRAISYAESCLGIVEHYQLGQIVGGPTAGTNGNINPFALPGGYQVVWTGMRVLKHDGTRHHGVGIQPTQAVTRSIQGVRQGKDELLEAAIRAVEK